MISLLQLLSNYVVLLPIVLIVALIIKRQRTITSDIIGLILFTSFLSDQISYYIGKMYGSNYWVINIYVIISILLIGLLIRSISNHKRIVANGYLLVLISFIVALILSDFNLFNGLFLAFYSLVNIIYCVLIFYEFFNKQEEIFIDKKPEFWFISGLLIYSAGSFFTFGFSSEILSNSELQFTFLHISNIVNVCFISIGLWRQMR